MSILVMKSISMYQQNIVKLIARWINLHLFDDRGKKSQNLLGEI